MITYSVFHQIWKKKGRCEEEIEDWWILWHNIGEEVGEWDDPRRFEILDQYCVHDQVCKTAFNASK